MEENKNNRKTRRLPTHFFWILGTFLILLVGFLAIIAALGLNHSYFKVDNYVITGNLTKSNEEIIEGLNLGKDQSIFTLDTDKIEESLMTMGDFESVEVKKVVPDSLKINIVEDKYIGYIQVDNGYLLIGANLLVEEHKEELTDLEKNELFKITGAGYDNLTLGANVSNLEREMKFLNDLKNHVLSTITTEVDFGAENGKVTISIKPETTVVFGDLTETDYKLSLVEKIVADLQAKEISPKEIILDGSPNPVVVTD